MIINLECGRKKIEFGNGKVLFTMGVDIDSKGIVIAMDETEEEHEIGEIIDSNDELHEHNDIYDTVIEFKNKRSFDTFFNMLLETKEKYYEGMED